MIPRSLCPPILATDRLAQLLKEAKGGPTAASPEAVGAASNEDVRHMPPGEQRVLTPVPLYVEVAESLNAVKVQVRYNPFGSATWKTVDMRKEGRGYTAEIPCLDVGTTTGNLKYFIQVIDTSGDVVGMSGNRASPNAVPIKNELSGAPPHLPGHPPPEACANATDCPVDLPGCARSKAPAGQQGGKPQGEACADDRECSAGLGCKVGICQSVGATAGSCETDSDCAGGGACIAGACEPPASKNWLTLSVQQEVLLLPAAADVCVDQTDYACFSDSEQYVGGAPYTPARGVDDRVAGGPALATTRLLLGFDRLFGDNVSLGGRIGYAFGGAPARTSGPSFFPFHLEARAAYWFGARPFAKRSVRPYVLVSGGAAQVDAKKTATLQNQDPQPNGMPVPPSDKQRELAAWRKTGTGFVALGGGAMIPVSRGGGMLIEAKVEEMIGNPATVFGAQIGYAVGF